MRRKIKEAIKIKTIPCFIMDQGIYLDPILNDFTDQYVVAGRYWEVQKIVSKFRYVHVGAGKF